MKTALVTGSSGFIGSNLVIRLQSEGYFVIGVDIEEPKYSPPDRFFNYDLRVQSLCHKIFVPNRFIDRYTQIDEIYNLACLMGGMGFIGDEKNSFDVMIGSTEIVSNILDCAVQYGVKKVFYSSSACVYNQFKQEDINNPGLKESDCYPAWPDLIYGWQKLCSEQMHIAANLTHGLEIRIARFHNIFGPFGSWNNGKEKAPAAMCRKVIEAKPVYAGLSIPEPGLKTTDGVIEVWGDGQQTRSFLYIDDCIDAVRLLMESDFKEPINIGSEEMVSINQLAQMAIDISGKQIVINNVPSNALGVRGRNSDNTLIRQVLNWEPKYTLKEGLTKTFNWIKSQYEK